MSGPVQRFRTAISWSGSTAAGYEAYPRRHRGTTEPPTDELALSASPAYRGDADLLDPEELVVMAASSCQLLSFLAVAARARIDVVAYEDDAVGEMPTDRRPVSIARIVLRPRITVRATPGDPPVDRGRIRHLCGVAHRECFIANSLRTEIVVEPDIRIDGAAG